MTDARDPWHDMSHAERYVRSYKLGQMADGEFRLRCRRLGIKWQDAIASPLASIAIAQAEKPPRRRRRWHRKSVLSGLGEV